MHNASYNKSPTKQRRLGLVPHDAEQVATEVAQKIETRLRLADGKRVNKVHQEIARAHAVLEEHHEAMAG